MDSNPSGTVCEITDNTKSSDFSTLIVWLLLYPHECILSKYL